jgi:uncharacterized protein (DUF1800 family)
MKRLILAAAVFATSLQASPTHVLNRLAFGPRPGDVERIQKMGVDRWIEEQLHPQRIDDRAMHEQLKRYETLSMSSADLLTKYYRPIVEARKAEEDLQPLRREAQKVIVELSAQRILRAAHSERQLNEVMVDFWMNHFNVFAGKGIDRFLLTSYERDVIRPHIWGRFEDLLMATAKSPAMLFYLDNARSQKRGVNENYAREIMELHTLGVDGGYTQKDVTELARALTGWSLARPNGFVFRRALHDRGAKAVLGVKLQANGGIEEGERMIRFLAAHPSTARHIAWKLCQRLVADDPPKSLVDRVARRFTETRGDLRETVKAVITSAEFNDPKYYGAKTKTPFEYAISAIRAVGGTIHNPLPLMRTLQKMGQPLYFAQPPTGYSDSAEDWSSSGALVERINFATALASNRLPGVRARDLSLADVALSAETRKTIASQTQEPAAVAGLILGSPEFQKQ